MMVEDQEMQSLKLTAIMHCYTGHCRHDCGTPHPDIPNMPSFESASQGRAIEATFHPSIFLCIRTILNFD
jgi:hypothetical protein